MKLDYPSIYRKVHSLYRHLPYYLLRGRAFPPLHIFIEVTYRCNIRCTFCQFYRYPESSEREGSLDELDSEEIQELIAQLPRNAIVTFTGGEPFVRRDMLPLLEWAARRRRVTFVSNGTRISSKEAELLTGLAPRSALGKGLLLADISLEGLGTTHNTITRIRGSFERTVAAIEAIVSGRHSRENRYPLLNIKTVVTEENVSELVDLYELATRLRVDIFNPMILSSIDAHLTRMTGQPGSKIGQTPHWEPTVNTVLLKDQLDTLRVKEAAGGPRIRFTPPGMPSSEFIKYYEGSTNLSEYYCEAPWSTVNVSAQGDVTTCPYMNFGNIRKTSFKEIWNSKEMRAFRQRLRAAKIFPGCLGCCNLSFCTNR